MKRLVFSALFALSSFASARVVAPLTVPHQTLSDSLSSLWTVPRIAPIVLAAESTTVAPVPLLGLGTPVKTPSPHEAAQDLTLHNYSAQADAIVKSAVQRLSVCSPTLYKYVADRIAIINLDRRPDEEMSESVAYIPPAWLTSNLPTVSKEYFVMWSLVVKARWSEMLKERKDQPSPFADAEQFAMRVFDECPIAAAAASATPATARGNPTLTGVPQFGQTTPNPSGATSCAQGCAVPPPGCVIKGNISSGQVKIYHVPGGAYYEATKIDPGFGERWFCTEQEAVANGWRKSLR